MKNILKEIEIEYFQDTDQGAIKLVKINPGK